MPLLSQQPVLVITGPTASGKSGLAMRLAGELDGEIISADSMQIYRHLDIGTAKVTPQEQAEIPHHLIDIVDPDENYSVAQFVTDASRIIQQIIARGKQPIVCGGTGLYILSLVDGLQFIEHQADPALRQALTERMRREGAEAIHTYVANLDPVSAARIHPHDEKRLIRFLEVYQQTGMTTSQVYAYSRRKGPDYHFFSYVLWPERDQLYRRINQRVEQMFQAGIVDELRAILERYPHFPETQAFQAIGYKEVLAYTQGQKSREEAIANLARSTRRYAKRQYTFFRSREDFQKIEEHDLQQVKNLILEDFCRRSRQIVSP